VLDEYEDSDEEENASLDDVVDEDELNASLLDDVLDDDENASLELLVEDELENASLEEDVDDDDENASLVDVLVLLEELENARLLELDELNSSPATAAAYTRCHTGSIRPPRDASEGLARVWISGRERARFQSPASLSPPFQYNPSYAP